MHFTKQKGPSFPKRKESEIMNIAILGYGIVGSGAYEVLTKNGYTVSRVLDVRPHPELGDVLTDNIEDILNDQSITVVAEAIGGNTVSYDLVSRALKAGKHVVSSNKHLICHYYKELHALARENGVTIRFTSSVGGGIPWLYNLKRAVRCDEIEKIMGIMNGTTNFILDAMIRDSRDFAEVLKEAQALGYAEADPAADIDGLDVARKVAISSTLAFGCVVSESDVRTLSLRNIKKSDIDYVRTTLGKTVRYLGYGIKTENGITAFVEPTILDGDTLEAHIPTNNNLISLFGKYVGRLSFYGQGAGKYPTGNALAQDIIDILKGETALSYPETNAVIADDAARAYFIRTKAALDFDFFESIDEKDGIRYILTKKAPVSEIHGAAKQILAADAESFIAGIE